MYKETVKLLLLESMEVINWKYVSHIFFLEREWNKYATRNSFHKTAATKN